MNTRRNKTLRYSGVAFLVLITVSMNGFAQSTQPKEKQGDAVVIALVPDRVMPSGSVKLARDYRKGRANIVYLRQSAASSGLLENAMAALVITLLESPLNPRQTSASVLTLKGGESTDPATRTLFAELVKAPPRSVDAAGLVPALVITLPDEELLKVKFRGRFKAKAG